MTKQASGPSKPSNEPNKPSEALSSEELHRVVGGRRTGGGLIMYQTNGEAVARYH